MPMIVYPPDPSDPEPPTPNPDAALLAAGKRFDVLLAAALAGIAALPKDTISEEDWCEFVNCAREPARRVAYAIYPMKSSTREGRIYKAKISDFFGRRDTPFFGSWGRGEERPQP